MNSSSYFIDDVEITVRARNGGMGMRGQKILLYVEFGLRASISLAVVVFDSLAQDGILILSIIENTFELIRSAGRAAVKSYIATVITSGIMIVPLKFMTWRNT